MFHLDKTHYWSCFDCYWPVYLQLVDKLLRWHPCVTCMFVILEGMEHVKRWMQCFWCSKVNSGSQQCSEERTKVICPPVFLPSVLLFAEILGSHAVLSTCLQTGETDESLASTHLACAIVGKLCLHISRESAGGTTWANCTSDVTVRLQDAAFFLVFLEML